MDSLGPGSSTGSQGSATTAKELADHRPIFGESRKPIAAAARAIAEGLRRKLPKTLWVPEQMSIRSGRYRRTTSIAWWWWSYASGLLE